MSRAKAASLSMRRIFFDMLGTRRTHARGRRRSAKNVEESYRARSRRVKDAAAIPGAPASPVAEAVGGLDQAGEIGLVHVGHERVHERVAPPDGDVEAPRREEPHGGRAHPHRASGGAEAT